MSEPKQKDEGELKGASGAKAKELEKYGGLTKRQVRRRIVKEWERKQKLAMKQQLTDARDTAAFEHFTAPSGRSLAGGQPFQFFFTLASGHEMPRVDDLAGQNGASDAAVVDQLFYDDVQRGALVQFVPPGTSDDLDRDDDAFTAPTSVLSVTKALHSAPVKDVHVKKLQQAQLLPYTPLDGVDLNKAPENYLTWDPMFGVHKHAPGFERNQSLATEALLTSAAQEIQDTGGNVDVISSGDAVKDIFEAAFTTDPLALRVHRIGPTVFLEAEPKLSSTTVDEARRAALLGKALYRIRQSFAGEQGAAVVTSAVASRISALSSRDLQQQHLHSFSHVLRWRLDNLNVLLGLDPPLLRGRDDGVEMMLRLQAEPGEVDASSNVLRDSLSCWFDATLANVPNVGVCIHREGHVQSFRLQKVQDLLNMVERKAVTSALSFTRNVLSWIVAQCTNDCVDYVVLRNASTNELELYECEQSQWIANRDAPPEPENDRGSRQASEASGAQGPASAGGGALDWAVANMCFHVGVHLLRTQPGKESQALPLFARCFSLFATHFIKVEARASMLDIGQMLGELVTKIINTGEAACAPEAASESTEDNARDGRATAGGHRLDLPNAYREPLVTLQQMLQTAQNVVSHEQSTAGAFYRVAVTVLHRVAAAVAVCSTMALHRYATLKAELAQVLALSPSSSVSDAVPVLRCSVLKNLLQVVVEGLLSLSRAATLVADSPNPLADSHATATSLVDARTLNVDPKFIGDAMLELLGDVASICMQSDQTTNFVLEVARRVASREGELSAPLRWLLDVTGDVTSLSISALRFFSKITPSRRVMIKSSYVYYLVGKHHAVTDRNTKALESLARSKEIFAAAQKCADDGNPALSMLPMPSVADLARVACASVYCRMAKARRDAAAAVAVVGLDSSESVVPLLPEEDRLLMQALEELGLANQDAPLLLLYCERMIDHKSSLNAAVPTIPAPGSQTCDRLSRDVNESWVAHVKSLMGRAMGLNGRSALATLCQLRLLTLAVRLGPANCPPDLMAEAVAQASTLPPALLHDVNLLLLQRRADVQRSIIVSFLPPSLATGQLLSFALTTVVKELTDRPQPTTVLDPLVSRLLRVTCGVCAAAKPAYAMLLAGLSQPVGTRHGVVLEAVRLAQAALLESLGPA